MHAASLNKPKGGLPRDILLFGVLNKGQGSTQAKNCIPENFSHCRLA